MSELLLYLISERSFYARIANALKRVPAPGLGTMAVGIHDGRITLYYDPEFLTRSSMRFLLFVLDHEMYHIAMDHIPRYLELLSNFPDPLARERAKAVHNIAMDCAVNTNLRNSPHFQIAVKETREYAHSMLPPDAEKSDKHGMVLPENYDLPLDKSFEWYLDELMPQVKFMVTRGASGSQVSEELMKRLLEDSETIIGKSHSMWDGGKKETQEEGANGAKDGDTKDGDASEHRLPEELQALAENIRHQAKQILRKAVRDQKQERGTIPGDVAQFLEAYLAEPIVPWWELLTSRIKVTKRSKVARGIQRPNRPLLAMSEEDTTIIPALGKLKDPKYRVFFMTDTSGSMDNESLAIACSELSHLLSADEDMEVRWIQGDSAVHYDKVFVTGQEITPEVHGRGGTDFNAYFDYMSQYVGNDETAPDIVIVYTDGYAPAVDEQFHLPYEIPVIWLVSRGGAADHLRKGNYGEIIHCTNDHNKMWKDAA